MWLFFVLEGDKKWLVTYANIGSSQVDAYARFLKWRTSTVLVLP